MEDLWITLGEAAALLRRPGENDDTSGRARVIELLRRWQAHRNKARHVEIQVPDVVCILPSNGDSPIPLPQHGRWLNLKKKDWKTSTIPADRLSPATSSHTLDQSQSRVKIPQTRVKIRVNRAAVAQAAQEERDAKIKSQENKLAVASKLYDEPFWPVARVLSWIAFRALEMIEASWRAGVLYPTSATGKALKDPRPCERLLRTLQEGGLRAIKDGQELSPEAWANATGFQSTDGMRFRRKDVLAVWPAETPQTATEDTRGRARVIELLRRRQAHGDMARHVGILPSNGDSPIPPVAAKPRGVAPETKCQKWLDGFMKSHARPEKSKAVFRTEAKELFPGIGVRAFDRAWERATEGHPAYKRAGPKTKKNT